MKLECEIKDTELLFDIIHELGKCFYKKVSGNRYEVVYLTGNRFAHFEGELKDDEINRLEGIGHRVDSIEVDESEDIVRIVQK